MAYPREAGAAHDSNTHMHNEHHGRHSHHLDRNRQARQAGRRRGHRPLRRHDGASSPPVTPPTARVGIDFLPLTVDYREYTYASGRIPGGFFKREGKPAEKEVLTSRLIDRPIRPLFPSGWFFETQIVALLISADTENDSDVLAITGASAALALSSIPFHEDDRRRARRPRRRRVHHQPDLRASASRARST